MTQSGYARIAKRWRRGTPLSAAETLYEAQPEDMAVFAYHDRTPGFERDFVGRSTDFYRRDYFLLMQDGRQKNRYPGRRRAGHASGMAADQTEQRLGGGRQALSVRRAAGGQLR